MKTLSTCLVVLVALLHFWFMVLETFLWQKPIGLKTFRLSAKDAKITAPLAANQGLYNGFLATGLMTSLFFNDPLVAVSFQVFFLICVIIAGIFGAATVNRRILWIQAAPAAIALMVVFARSRAG